MGKLITRPIIFYSDREKDPNKQSYVTISVLSRMDNRQLPSTGE